MDCPTRCYCGKSLSASGRDRPIICNHCEQTLHRVEQCDRCQIAFDASTLIWRSGVGILCSYCIRENEPYELPKFRYNTDHMLPGGRTVCVNRNID